MREIKFRAWNKRTKHMYYGIGLTTTGKMMFGPPYEDQEVMQFTGLHDRNGKEIWEGDIISSFGCLGKMIYTENRARFSVIGRVPSRRGNHHWIPLRCWGKGEIIGNIYENPELLEAK